MPEDMSTPEDVSNPGMYYIFAGAGVGLLLLILVVIGIVCICKNKFNKTTSKDPCEEPKLEDHQLLSPKIQISKFMDGNIDLPRQEEFDILFKYKDDITSRLTTYQGHRNNDKAELNENRNILPYDHNRIQLTNPIQGSDYINASKVKKCLMTLHMTKSFTAL